MNRRTFILTGVGGPFLACSIIPDIVVAPLSGQWGTNLFWGPVFGFGWWVAQSTVGIEHWRAAANIGLFVWPTIVLAGLYLLSRLVWQFGDGWRKAFLWLLAVSLLPIIPAKTAMFLYSNAAVPPDFNYLLATS